jgi:hypothetical protein
MISYEEVEKDLRDKNVAVIEKARLAELAEKEAKAKAKAENARYNATMAVSVDTEQGAATENFIDLNGVKSRSCEVVVALLNQGKLNAMLQALPLFNLVFLATSHGQKDSEVLAYESQKLARLLMNWPG